MFLEYKRANFSLVFVEPTNNLNVCRRKPVIQADDKCEMNRYKFSFTLSITFFFFTDGCTATLASFWTVTRTLIPFRTTGLVSCWHYLCQTLVISCFPNLLLEKNVVESSINKQYGHQPSDKTGILRRHTRLYLNSAPTCCFPRKTAGRRLLNLRELLWLTSSLCLSNRS